MPKIYPVSDLRNYSEIVNEVKEAEPVYLTKNGKGSCALVDMSYIERYDRMKTELNFLKFVLEGEQAGNSEGWLTLDEFREQMDYKE